jgi:hypothetical protein
VRPSAILLSLFPCFGAAAFALGCHSPGPFGHSRVYSPRSDEERAVAGAQDYDPGAAQRTPDRPRAPAIWLFGVVTNRGSGPGGAAYVTLSMRSLQQRNLCESEDEDSCRVTVSDREFGRIHALVKLSAEDELGQDGVGVGSLLRIVGRVGQDVDPNDGTPILRTTFYRHWPRGSYVTASASRTMRR